MEGDEREYSTRGRQKERNNKMVENARDYSTVAGSVARLVQLQNRACTWNCSWNQASNATLVLTNFFFSGEKCNSRRVSIDAWLRDSACIFPVVRS